LKALFKNLFLPSRFFFAGGIILLLFIIGFVFPFVFILARLILLLFLAAIITDILLLFRRDVKITCLRILPNVFSLSDENPVHLDFVNDAIIPLNISVIEELPEQFQERKFNIKLALTPGESKKINYFLRPLSRGEYNFGKTLLYISSLLGLVERRIIFPNDKTVAVFPSIIQMKKFELQTFSRIAQFRGVRKIQRLGHSYEFEHIKNYVQGDDYRSINWKATGKRGALMVNQYEDERAQQVYFILDKSRSMRMPFHGLSLLDYAINTTLAMSNITLRKQDRVGMITFATTINSFIKADRNHSQLRKILSQLYREKENPNESNYELLYSAVRNSISVRSLMVLYTNFESIYAMERILPVLRRLNRQHLLLVVFFENSELVSYAKEESTDMREIYYSMVASKMIDEKEQIIYQLKLYGIQAIQTAPENLTVNVLNKYLELKARGMI
jgi:uncharacterized protein (DUF58 family)